jgi:hypothetical protein
VDAAVFLASRASDYEDGHVLWVDGDMLAALRVSRAGVNWSARRRVN